MATIVFVHGVGERPGPGVESALADWIATLAAPMPPRLEGWLRSHSAMAYYQDWDWLDADVTNLRRPSHPWETVKEALSDAVEEARVAYDEIEPKRISDLSAVAERWAESEKVLAASNLAADQVSAFNLWQVSAFLEDIEGSRRQVLDRFAAAMADDTRVVIAHSLGSVVAYEAAHEIGFDLDALITLGSPLGVDGYVRHRLTPPDLIPPGVGRWVNICHPTEPVALTNELAPIFRDPPNT